MGTALFFQQFLDSALHGKLHESQSFRTQVVSAVPLEAEVQELAQMISVLMGHDHFGFPYEIIVHAGHLGFGILQNVFLALQGFGACQIQQCIAVVKQRSRGDNLVGVAVHQETEISVVPVSIENHGVKTIMSFNACTYSSPSDSQNARTAFIPPLRTILPTGTKEMSLLVNSSQVEHRVSFQREME